ncbi:hypothetical protein [Candidatus Enterococcus murrayae]|uniref:Uncharacterized protein n=1 Tax=Candidatus Enterococcus murrayae TaxID=2815321 RepID=A0ABS3HNN6_9ENTE|nr:hypothetical protein [Enterococcus sp. MJM16]MBO0455067.1 hypothetical protein [Enterococcus sp. MJM16]
MTKEEYLNQIVGILRQEKIEYALQQQIIETVTELLEQYNVEFVSELLPSLFKI